VERLMIRHQFGQIEFASEQWFRLAASTLAAATRSAGIATAAKPQACRVRRVDLVTSGGRLANLVVVLAEGPVKQALLTMEDSRDQDALDDVARQLNQRLAGRSLDGVEAVMAALHDEAPAADPLLRNAVERIARVMREFDAAAVEDVFSEGLLNVMDAPEFARSEKLRRVFLVLQDRDYLGRLLPDLMAGSVRVYIGAENAHEEMHDVSLVLAPYGRSGRAMGVVGVVGPTRMAYPHAISSVRYVSGLMNELVDHLYA
jgi:heat-inducible transcriptional repressor